MSDKRLKISCHGCAQKLDVSDLEPFIKILCPTCDGEIIIPKPFGNLLLEEDLGTGEIATVYRSIDLTLDREIAVKVLNEKYARDPELQELFISEARNASAINHPNVIPIYSCGEMDDHPYLVMQYMEGGSLADTLKHRAEPPIRTVCNWFHEVARGLEAASIHGVLHHDVCPGNILLDGDGNIKIADFGLAQIIYRGLRDGEDAPPDTAIFDLRRARYVSPEKISTGREDISGDIFSFGASLYHVITGKAPFDGEVPGDVLQARFRVRPPEPRTLRGDIPEPVNALIMRCLQIYPSERPASYNEIAKVLVEQPAKPAPAPKPEAEPPGNSPARQPRKPARSKRPRRKVINVSPAQVAGAGSTPVPIRPAPAWGPRILLIAIILAMLLLLICHITNPPWYDRNIRPMLTPPTAT